MPVVYQSKIKGPGNKSTSIWWDIVRDSGFSDSPLLMMDNLRAHFAPSLRQEMESYGVTVVHFPNYAGSLLNPCDNSWNSDLKHRYYYKSRRDHGEMIAAIRSAVYETTEESIRNYFHHCGYTSDEISSQVVERLVSEGYGPDRKHGSDHAEMRKKYAEWRAHVNHLRAKGALKEEFRICGKRGENVTNWHVYDCS